MGAFREVMEVKGSHEDRVLPDPELKQNSEGKGESAHKWKFIQIPKTILRSEILSYIFGAKCWTG